MDIRVRSTGSYKGVEVHFDDVTIDLGLCDDDECRSLANELISAYHSLTENSTLQLLTDLINEVQGDYHTPRENLLSKLEHLKNMLDM